MRSVKLATTVVVRVLAISGVEADHTSISMVARG
jgi:hypothetical protein